MTKDLEVPDTLRGPAAGEADEKPPKKLSLAIPEAVHRAEKIGAYTRGNTMLSEVIELLRARNGLGRWPADVVEQVRAQIAEDEADLGGTAKTRTTRTRRGA